LEQFKYPADATSAANAVVGRRQPSGFSTVGSYRELRRSFSTFMPLGAVKCPTGEQQRWLTNYFPFVIAVCRTLHCVAIPWQSVTDLISELLSQMNMIGPNQGVTPFHLHETFALRSMEPMFEPTE
jgi:hypothetical protein